MVRPLSWTEYFFTQIFYILLLTVGLFYLISIRKMVLNWNEYAILAFGIWLFSVIIVMLIFFFYRRNVMKTRVMF